MDLDVQDDGARFTARVDGESAGFATYERADGLLTATHTVVDPAFEGRGVGSALVRAVVAAARDAGDGLLPQCSFVRAHLLRSPEDLALVPADARERFGLPAA
ncbi:MAG: hypothetical protein JWM64_2909 [Frankiales bacterium]|nr:hypothetical protein [Frankiales bacterium]